MSYVCNQVGDTILKDKFWGCDTLNEQCNMGFMPQGEMA